MADAEIKRITPDEVIDDTEFSSRLDKLRAELPLVEMIMKRLGSLDAFPEHLRSDVIAKMGLEEHVNPTTGFVYYTEKLVREQEAARG